METKTNKKPKYNEIVFTKQQEKQIIDMYLNQNISTVKIGNQFSCSHKRISKTLEKYGVTRNNTKCRRKYELNEYYFDNIDTPNKAYILGFFYADGCNFIKKQTISMSLQECDKEILEKIRMELGSSKELEFLEYSKRKDMDNDYHYADMYRLLLFSSHMCEVLNDYGMIPNKSLKLEFPEWLDESLYSHFIRGYFDGDGSLCIRFNKHGWFQSFITFTSTDSFCKRVQEIIIDKVGISGGGIYEASSKNSITKVLSISGINQDIALLNWIYKDADLYMERKYQKYLELLTHQNKSLSA